MTMTHPAEVRRVGLWVTPAEAKALHHQGSYRLIGDRVILTAHGFRFEAGATRCHVRVMLHRREAGYGATATNADGSVKLFAMYQPMPANVLPPRLRARLNRRSWLEGGDVSRLN